MIKRSLPPMIVATFALACASGEGNDTMSDFSASFSSSPGDGDGDEDGSTTEPGDGDPSTGDGDPSTGDGDPTTGDGDPSGDGDGDPVDPCVQICDSTPDSTPDSCDKPYIIGRTSAKSGFFFGGNTQAASNSDSMNCGPHDVVENIDNGADHFFRVYLVEGDTVTASLNPNGWLPVLKIHDEAECVGNARECAVETDPVVIEYTAQKTDWFTIVVDGRVFNNDKGDYSLTVDLVTGPNIDECGCP